MNPDTYFIPANFTDAGRVGGIFPLRNVIEALVLGLPTLGLCAVLLPFAVVTKIIVTLVIFVPVAGFALIGVNDDSLSRYISAWWKWRKSKRTLSYRGETHK